MLVRLQPKNGWQLTESKGQMIAMYDLIVIGGGPAGLTAALYALRNGKKVLVIEKSVFGGQITNSPKVENIPGFASISGDEFADKFLDQVMAQGGEVKFATVTGITNLPSEESSEGLDGAGVFARVSLDDGSYVDGLCAVIATGTKHRVFGFEKEDELIGNGVHFCAVCDGDFYKDKTVIMIGGGNSAFVESNLLVDIVDKLIILQDLPIFTADSVLQDQLFKHTNLETHVNTKIIDYEVTDGKLTGVIYADKKEDGSIGETKVAKADGVFLAIGLIPDNQAFANIANLDKWGYFDSGENCATNYPNIFVAGDCRTKTLRQVSTACADGAQAAINACNYLRNIG